MLKPTLKVLLQQGDVLTRNCVCLYVQQHSSDLNVCDNFNIGKTFRNDEFLSNILHEIQIILYHNDFGVSNPLGNKRKKYKTSTFYFVFW